LRRIQDINHASSLKRLWDCCTSTSIWANWMKEHYLKGNSKWEEGTYPVDSFVWKNIIAARQLASLHMFQNPIGNWPWTASPKGIFSLASAWNIVRAPDPIFEFCDVICFQDIIPKYLAAP